MMRFVCCLALLVAPAVWAESTLVRDLAWSEMIPTDAATSQELPLAQHDGGEEAPAAIQIERNAPLVKALDGAYVRLPGYIVPLETQADGRVTEFFLVPYFGACIHVPPPPSNQIIYIRSKPGVVQEALYQPYWVTGWLKVGQSHHELAEAGYSLRVDQIELYELPEEEPSRGATDESAPED